MDEQMTLDGVDTPPRAVFDITQRRTWSSWPHPVSGYCLVDCATDPYADGVEVIGANRLWWRICCADSELKAQYWALRLNELEQDTALTDKQRHNKIDKLFEKASDDLF